MQVVEHPVSYHDRLTIRESNAIELIVLHCTELPTLELARQFAEKIVNRDNQTGNCGHYYVDRDGMIHRYVMDDRIANHVVGHNANSIGIELVNDGRYPHWFWSTSQKPTEPYSVPQIVALNQLLQELRTKYPRISRITRHSDLDTRMIAAEDDPSVLVRRRIDPGPMFPWDDVLKSFEALQRS